MTETLFGRLSKEMARVRALLPLYDEIPTGGFAAAFMRLDLKRAEKAMDEGDAAGMVRACESLMDYRA